MQKIEEIALDTYQKNMTYLQKSHPILYKDLLNLDLAMQNQHYIQQFELEYINDNFDIQNISSKKYLYGKKSNFISKEITKGINFKKTDQTIESFAIFPTTKKTFQELDKSAYESRKHIYPMMNYYLENTKEDSQLKEIVKFIFLGVGLGLHITSIHKKIQAKSYLIIEDDIEIFKLSLFTCEYFEISKSAELSFAILEDIDTFTDTFTKYLEHGYIHNYKLKYTHFQAHSHTKFKHIISILSAQSFSIFPYQLQLEKSLSPINYIKKSYKFLDVYSKFNPSILANKPILMLGAGPSLSNNINWLRENHKKFVIVAVSATLKYLHDNKITPDIVTHVDGSNAVTSLFKGYDAKDYLKDSILIFSPMTKKNIIELFDKDNIFMFEVSTKYFSIQRTYSYTCVGSFSYMFSIILGAENIYLLGLDLAIDQETGNDHLDEHVDHQNIDIKDKSKLETNINIFSTLVPVEGNFSTTVYTTPIFHYSINAIKDYVPNIINNNQKVFNLNQGSKLSYASPMDLNNIKTNKLQDIDKKELFRNLHSSFNTKSFKNLNTQDFKRIKQRYNFVKDLKIIIDNHNNIVSHSNYDTYSTSLTNLYRDITNIEYKDDMYDIVEVYTDYFKYAYNIMYDFFNTKNLKNTKKHIKSLDKMMINGVNDIYIQLDNSYKELLK